MALQNHVIKQSVENQLINGGLNLHQYSGFPYSGIAVADGAFGFIGPDRLAIKREGVWSTPPQLSSESADLPPNIGVTRGIKFVNGIAGAITDEVYLRYRMEGKDAVKNLFKSLSTGFYVKPVNFDTFTVTLRRPAATLNDFSSVIDIGSKQVVSSNAAWHMVKFENFIIPSESALGIEIEIKAKVAAIGAASLILAGFMLNQGSFVGDFKQYDPKSEILDAQRYFEKSFQLDQVPAGNISPLIVPYESNNSSIQRSASLYFSVIKSIIPSVVIWNGGPSGATGTVHREPSAGGGALFSTNPDQISINKFNTSSTGTGAGNYLMNYTAQAEL